MGDWSEWNDYFRVSIVGDDGDGTPEIGDTIRLYSRWHFGFPSCTEERVSVATENGTLCWEHTAIGLCLSDDLSLFVPSPSFTSLRCVEMRDAGTNEDTGEAVTNVRNFAEFDTLLGRLSLVFYGSRIEHAFAGFLDALAIAVADDEDREVS